VSKERQRDDCAKMSLILHAKGKAMDDFPEFMKHGANRIATSSQATPGVEGYVFDGADGSQIAFWTCHETAASVAHVHEFDEYMIVVQGCYTLILGDRRIPIKAGEEYFIPKGLSHGGEVVAGGRGPSTPSVATAPRGLARRSDRDDKKYDDKQKRCRKNGSVRLKPDRKARERPATTP
jgi:mannose-6-phosphate isomerase-like protein (cupin superfamily)